MPQHPPPITPGVLPHHWLPAEAADFRVHAYNEDLYILRQSGRTHYEKPFLYLLFGEERALLLDTGAGNANVRAAVDRTVDSWQQLRGRSSIELVVAHTHAHDDHIAGDSQFRDRADTTHVAPTLAAVVDHFGFRNWPEEIVEYDLGGRLLDVIPIPGHEATSIAVYDRRTALLLTGDTLYAGRLYVEDAAAFARSIRRLVDFTRDKPVAHLLGCHIENSRTPYLDYPVGTTDQPDEHALELGRAHLLELDAALQAMNGNVERLHLRDFTVWPVDAQRRTEETK